MTNEQIEINVKFEINECAISTPASAVAAIKVPKVSVANLTHQGNDATNPINGKANDVADNLQQMINDLLPATFEPLPVSLSANVADDDDIF